MRLPSASPQAGYAHVVRGQGVVAFYDTLDQAMAAIRTRDPNAAVGYQGPDPHARRSNPPKRGTLASGDARVVGGYDRIPELALKRSTLPTVTAAQVDAISLERAHKALQPYFKSVAHLHTSKSGALAWKKPQALVESFLRENVKVGKSRAGYALAVLGLSLVPHALAFGAEPDPRHLCSYKKKSKATLCLYATEECACVCLVHSGNNANTRYAYELKHVTAQALLERPVEFLRVLQESIGYWRHRLSRYTPGRQQGKTRKKPHRLVVRLNMLSDVPWELVYPDLFGRFSDTPFYDYTKVPGRVTPENYDLTFSYSGVDHNIDECQYELSRGHRIAVAFLLPGHMAKHSHEDERARQRRYPLPKRVGPALGLPEHFLGLPVLDGDLDDLRFLDPPNAPGPGGNQPCVVGLRYKDPMGQTKTVEGVPKTWAAHREQFDPRTGAPIVKHFVVRYRVVDGVAVTETTPLIENVDDPNTRAP